MNSQEAFSSPPIDQIIYAQAFGGEVSFTWKSRTAASVLGPKIPSVELLGALDKAQQAFRRWLAQVLPHAQDRQARGDLAVCLWRTYRDPLPSTRSGGQWGRRPPFCGTAHMPWKE